MRAGSVVGSADDQRTPGVACQGDSSCMPAGVVWFPGRESLGLVVFNRTTHARLGATSHPDFPSSYNFATPSTCVHCSFIGHAQLHPPCRHSMCSLIYLRSSGFWSGNTLCSPGSCLYRGDDITTAMTTASTVVHHLDIPCWPPAPL